MAVMVSRANIESHAHLVAACVTVGVHTAVVFLSDEQWLQVLRGSALELMPGAIALEMEKGVCDQ